MPLDWSHKGRGILIEIENYTLLRKGRLCETAWIHKKHEYFDKVMEKIRAILNQSWTSREVLDLYLAVRDALRESKKHQPDWTEQHKDRKKEFLLVLPEFAGAIRLVYMVLREKERKAEEKDGTK